MRPPTLPLPWARLATGRSGWSRPGSVGDGDQLVDEAGGRVAGAGDEVLADLVAVDGGVGGSHLGDAELVEIARDHDLGLGGAGLVEDPPGDDGVGDEIAGVDADLGQRSPARLDGVADAGGGVVGVDEEGGGRAEAGDLGIEGEALVGVGAG